MKVIARASFSAVVLLVAIPAGAVRAALPPRTINAPPTVLGDDQELDENVTLNVLSGGVVGNNLYADFGSKVNVSGGTIGNDFFATTNTQVTITGGSFGSGFFAGSDSPGFAKISGGTFGPDFDLAGTGTELIGGEFRINGAAVSGIAKFQTISDIFTCVLKDGTVMILSPLVDDSFTGIGAKLTTAALPAPPSSPLTVSASNGPRGLRAGKTLNLVSGGTLIDNFAAVDAVLNISGGTVGDGLEVVGTQVNVTGGVVGDGFHAFAGTTVNVSGGTIRGGYEDFAFQSFAGSSVDVTGGEFGYVTANSGSQWNISDGNFKSHLDLKAGSSTQITGGRFSFFQAANGSTANISAGQFGSYLRAAGNQVSIEAGDFLLNGAPYAGATVTLGATDVLIGAFSDGSVLVLTPLKDDSLEGVTLVHKALPAATTLPITVNSASAPAGLRPGQTLNLVSGGVLPDLFGIASAKLNVTGGTAGVLRVDRSQIAVSGGTVAGINLFYGEMNVQGGSVGDIVADYSHVDLLPGGTVNSIAIRAGSTAAMTGGTLNGASVSEGGVLTVTGGTVQTTVYVYPGSAAHISNASVGGLYANQLSAADITNTTLKTLQTIDNTVIDVTNTTITSRAILSGKVNFYNSSIPNGSSAQRLGTINIHSGTVGSSFTADFDSVVNILGGQVGANFKTGLHSKVTISGGSVGSTFNANDLSTITITGGSVGDGFNANSGSTVNISGGTVGAMFDAFAGSTVNLTGGSVGSKLNVPGGTFKIAGGSIGENALVTNLVSTARAKLTMGSGSIGNGFRVQGYFSQPNPNVAPVVGPATVEISGGTVGSGFTAGVASIVNISGGVFGDAFVAEKGSTINLLGSSFLLDGQPIAGLVPNVPFKIESRDVTLTGLFRDGSPFEFDLRSSVAAGDRFDPLATLMVTLSVPEPGAATLAVLAACAALLARRRR